MGDHVAAIEVPLAESLIYSEIAAERTRQDEKWGEQNHPDGTGPEVPWTFYPHKAKLLADAFRAETKHKASLGTVTWLDILLEEVAEGFAEEDPGKLRAELIQVAAVCVEWVAAIDRR